MEGSAEPIVKVIQVKEMSRLKLTLLRALHLLVVCGLIVVGYALINWALDIFRVPIAASDINAEWWQIFRRFGMAMQAGLFFALGIAYVVLIRPGRH